MSRARTWIGAAMISLFLPMVAALPAEAEGQILNAAAAAPVKDSYIVTLKDSETLKKEGVEREARRLAKKFGGGVGFVYTSALTGFQALMTAKKAQKLAGNAAVASVEQDSTIQAVDTQSPTPSWGIDRVDQRNLPLSNSYTYNTTASNVTAYIIDTGILTSHSDFGGRARHGRDTVDNDNDATDCQGHGTHVAGTVGGTAHGVAKGVSLVAVRVLNCSGSGTNAGVIAGVDWVTANAVKPAVANMSLGGGANTSLDNAVTNSIASGVSYAVAAGNENTSACNRSPARTPNAITVGATTSSDSRDTSYSNYGTCLDLFAPGSGITSAWIGSNTATRTISGTSMASPHAAGAAALVLAGNPAYTPAQVTSALVNAATTGVVANAGTGSPNRLLFTAAGTTPPPPPPCATFTNGTDYAILDLQTVNSPVTVSGCTGNASSAAQVAVDINHTYRGDLRIDLIAPDGTAYRLKNSSSSDSADNVKTTYSVNLSSEARNGTWTLRVADVYNADQGTLNSWSITP